MASADTTCPTCNGVGFSLFIDATDTAVSVYGRPCERCNADAVTDLEAVATAAQLACDAMEGAHGFARTSDASRAAWKHGFIQGARFVLQRVRGRRG